jgi:hypothetical protein
MVKADWVAAGSQKLNPSHETVHLKGSKSVATPTLQNMTELL